MKILIIHNQYQQAGGEQSAVDAQVRLLRSLGYEVILYQRDNQEIEHYNLLSKIRFIFQTIFSFRTVREINKIIRTEHPDIAHVHNVFPLISPSVYLVLHRKGIPVIQTIHNFRFLCPNGLFYTRGKICERCKMGNMWFAIRWRCYRNSRMLSALYALSISLHRTLGTFKKISAFITLNSFSYQKLIETGLAVEENIKLIPNFLYLPPPILRYEKKLADVVFIGRLSEEKGISVLIESLRSIPELCLHIIGTGPMESELRQQASKYDNRVIFEGFATGERKWKLLQNAQMVVIPSMWYEQFPITALEAMASGTPVIASNIGGLPSIVKDGINGFLFEPGNSEDLAGKIQVLLNDPILVQKMGLNGRQMVEQQFSADAHAASLIEYYQHILQNT